MKKLLIVAFSLVVFACGNNSRSASDREAERNAEENTTDQTATPMDDDSVSNDMSNDNRLQVDTVSSGSGSSRSGVSGDSRDSLRRK